MTKNTKINLNLNVNKDDADLNDFIYCWEQFGTRPNKISLHDNFLTSDFLEIVSDKTLESNTFSEIIPDPESDIVNDKILAKISDSIYLSYITIDKNQEDSMISDIFFYYKEDIDREEVDGLINSLSEYSLTKETQGAEESHKLNTVVLGSSGLDLEKIISKSDLDAIELFYHNKTFKSVGKLVKKLKKETGLTILFGERGTGKTSIINYLSEKLDKTVIFVPNTMIEHTINNPDFRRFLKKYHKVLLVLDDCEMSFNEYFVKSNFIVNNLIQLVDGFLSESNELSILTIFNVESDEEIDHNLLDCNNLIDLVHFDSLSGDEATELADHIGSKNKYKNKTKLIDIIKKRSAVDNKKIGF